MALDTSRLMTEAPKPPTLSDLDARLRACRRRRTEDEVRRFHRRIVLPSGMLDFSSRVGNDLIAAVMISIAFGAAIDAAFDSWPWGMVGLFLLGAAAAVRNVHQTACRMAETEGGEPAGPVPPQQITQRG